jgi:hypothetical protein
MLQRERLVLAESLFTVRSKIQEAAQGVSQRVRRESRSEADRGKPALVAINKTLVNVPRDTTSQRVTRRRVVFDRRRENFLFLEINIRRFHPSPVVTLVALFIHRWSVVKIFFCFLFAALLFSMLLRLI